MTRPTLRPTKHIGNPATNESENRGDARPDRAQPKYLPAPDRRRRHLCAHHRHPPAHAKEAHARSSRRPSTPDGVPAEGRTRCGRRSARRGARGRVGGGEFRRPCGGCGTMSGLRYGGRHRRSRPPSSGLESICARCQRSIGWGMVERVAILRMFSSVREVADARRIQWHQCVVRTRKEHPNGQGDISPLRSVACGAGR